MTRTRCGAWSLTGTAALLLALAACSGDEPVPPAPDQPAVEESAPPLEPVTDPDESILPPWAHGLERVVAVDVPADGEWHALDLGGSPVRGAELAWVLDCDPANRPAAGVREGGDVQLRGDPGATPAVLSCHPGAPWDGAVRGVLGEDGEQLELRTAHSGADETPVRVGVYRPADWEGYPFADSATGLFGDDPHWLAAGDALGGDSEAVLQELTRLTGADLVDGGTSLTVPTARDLVVQVRIDGPGRVRVTLDGRPLTPWAGEADGPQLVLSEAREGWLANWSAGPAAWEMSPLFAGVPGREWGHAPRGEAALTVAWESPEDGSVELVVLEAVVPEGR